MIYNIVPQQIHKERRSEINEKIVFCIDTGKNELSKETVFNCYTGIGGLHHLKQEDYPNYHEYAKAKREIEMGQFFTPHEICRQMVEIASPGPDDTVLDMCCGMANFFNYLPNLYNTCGFDIEPNSVKVARHLYPEANIEVNDIRRWNPEQRFDLVIGNPPFNLDWTGKQSQYVYCTKAADVLNPAGLLLMIVPRSFLQSDFWNKSQVTAIDRDFSFIGQTLLPDNAFTSLGVDKFETKIMAFLRESDHIDMQPYSAETFLTMEELKQKVAASLETKKGVRLRLHRETKEAVSAEAREFEYRLKKYLYELKAHEHLKKHYPKAIALVAKFRNRKPPAGCSAAEYAQWEKRKLTCAQILSVIRRYIKNQNTVARKEISLVKTAYGFKLKAYAPHLMDGVTKRYVSICDLVAHGYDLPGISPMTPKLRKQYAAAKAFIAKKKREYDRQSIPFAEMQRDMALDNYMDSLTFINKEMETCRFTELQKHDMGLFFQKRYSLLNWQQGSGKTAVAYHYAKYLLERKAVKNAIILAPSIAVQMTWEPFMKRNGEAFRILSRPNDFRDIPEGTFLIVSISMLTKLKRRLKRLMKEHSQNLCLLFDESDEITSTGAQRTKSALHIFRKLKYKLLTTGTTTRNNINELYSQLELLYNNSINMICYCRDFYSENKEKEIESKPNRYYGDPFPQRHGATLFKGCFCPGKATVFGIEKLNQDVYQKDELWKLIGKTVITRKFREFAGDKYSVQTHTVKPSEGEKEVYRVIMQEFYRICDCYFNSTGDRRKDTQLQIIRQMKLLIKACSVPNLMPHYSGDKYPVKTHKIREMLSEIGEKAAIGCTTLDALTMYKEYLANEFPDRPQFVISGDVSFKKRQSILDRFEATGNGILLCTQQSLKSSANVPSCNHVILESLQWNIPRMEQFYFRFIRLDSKQHKQIHFVLYKDSIEQNLIALVLAKERLNEFIKTGEIMNESEIFDEFDISPSLIESMLTREPDEDGKFHITWGKQKVS